MTVRAQVSPANLRAGIGLTLTMALFFAIGDTFVKLLGPTFPVVTMLLARYGVQLVTMSAWKGWRAMGPASSAGAEFRTAHPRFQLTRALLILVNTGMGIFAIRLLPLAEFSALVMLSPLAATVLARVVLKERVTLARWAMVALGFGGVLLIIKPGVGELGWPALIPLCMALMFASFQILTSRMSSIENPFTTHFYTGLITSVVLGGLTVLMLDDIVATVSRATPVQWGMLVVMALFGSFGHLFMILAIGKVPISFMTSFSYSQMAFATFFGAVVFNQLPDAWSGIGMAIIAVAGAVALWLSLREAARRQMPVNALNVDTHFE